MTKYTIDLDCAPGYPRPDDIFPDALKDTPFKPEDFKLISKFFGNFCWETKENIDDKYLEFQPVIKKNIEDMYHAGLIRYGSW